MIHYGKSPDGYLQIFISSDEIGEVYEAIQSAGLQQRRTFNGLKEYITSVFTTELKNHQLKNKQK